MKRKNIIILCILVLNFLVMNSNINLNARAQATYNSDLSENDEFIWEVRELDLHNFKKVFGFEPAFELGDKIKKIIRNMLEVEYGWSITVEEWDYDSNFEASGVIKYATIPKYPQDYEENLFIPTPVNEYLNDAKVSGVYLDDAYSVSGSVLSMFGKGPYEDRYIMEKEYDFRGVLVSEKYLSDPERRVIVHVAGTWTIPFGDYFFGFMAFAIVGLVIIMINKKRYQAHY